MTRVNQLILGSVTRGSLSASLRKILSIKFLPIVRPNTAVFLFTSLLTLVSGQSYGEVMPGNSLTDDDWIHVTKDARNFVRLEGSPLVDRESYASLVTSEKTVIAHYFLPFPLSIDNKPFSDDYYTLNYLQISGEKGKFAARGGYIRERPLPVGPWPQARYAETNLAIEVLRAERIGIDSFGVDLLTTSKGPLWANTLRLFDVASHVSAHFKITPEPDMAALRDVSEQELMHALATLYVYPSSMHLPDGRMLVIPFLAEARDIHFWELLIQDLAKNGTPIALMPDFLSTTRLGDFAPIMAGATFWGGRDVEGSKGYSEWADTIDKTYRKIAMLPIAAQDFRPKSGVFWESNNFDTLICQWRTAMKKGVRFVHLLTWNDYSEATEISPSTGTQYSTYDLTAYLIAWYKTGYQPTLRHDVLLYSQRRQIFDPRGAVVGHGMADMEQAGSATLTNNVQLISILKAPGTISIQVGERTTRKPATFGIDFLSVPAEAGTRPSFALSRSGVDIIRKTSDWAIEEHPAVHDALYVGGSSSRLFVHEGARPGAQ